MLALTSVFCALLVPARPPLQRGHGLQAAPRAGLTPSGSGTAALLGAATSSVAAPAVADDGSIVDTAVNLGLSVAVLAFVGVIGKFALEAAGMVGGAMADPGKRIEDALGNDPPAEPKARTPSAGPNLRRLRDRRGDRRRGEKGQGQAEEQCVSASRLALASHFRAHSRLCSPPACPPLPQPPPAAWRTLPGCGLTRTTSRRARERARRGRRRASEAAPFRRGPRESGPGCGLATREASYYITLHYITLHVPVAIATV